MDGHFDLVLRTLRERGVRALALKVLDALGLYRRMVLLCIPLAPSAPQPSLLSARVMARTLAATTEDVASYARLRPDTSVAGVRARLDGGAICGCVSVSTARVRCSGTVCAV